MIDIANVVGKQESDTLEYKAVLPPAKNIAQIISSFANTNGGTLILGVSDTLEVNGLSDDFHANSITHKAIDLLEPKPVVKYQYSHYEKKKLYVIQVDKSDVKIYLEGKYYERHGTSTKLMNPTVGSFRENRYKRPRNINSDIENLKPGGTNSKVKFIEHYQSILHIIDDLGKLLYPIDANKITTNQEGKVLSRILYSSFVDNFETYLSDILYEIFLAYPSTLKSNQTVKVEEVLNCADMEEFIKYWSKQKIGKLQKGSVEGFIKENKAISSLKVVSPSDQSDIEGILQIRHLYAHRNGIVDEKFIKSFPLQYPLNSEHQMPIEEFLDKMTFLVKCVEKIDQASKQKYNLASDN